MSFLNWKNDDACIGSPDSYLGSRDVNPVSVLSGYAIR